ncbi:MAG: hypothetical protein P8H22_09905 [Glaciecola sp.]|nr:hypothetical protein [Glaciecola sp.]
MSLFLKLIGLISLLTIMLCMWRLFFQYTDLAFFALTPIFVVLLMSSYNVHLNVKKHIYLVAIKTNSPLKNIFSGRISAFILAFLFSSSATFTIAYVCISVDPYDSKMLILFVLFGFAASFLYSDFISRHLNAPYSKYLGMNSMSYFLSILLVGCIALQSWNEDAYSVNLLTVEFLDALLIGIQNAPIHSEGSIIAEAFVPLYAYEAFKFWAVNKLGGYLILKMLLSIDSAVVGVLLAKSIVTVSFFFNKNENNVGDINK